MNESIKIKRNDVSNYINHKEEGMKKVGAPRG